MIEWLKGVPAISYLSALAGACGGFVLYLNALRQNRVRSKFVRKAVLEITGGTIIGFFLSGALGAAGASNEWMRGFAAFAGGIGWHVAVETIQNKTTTLVRAAFHEAIPGGQDGEGEESSEG